MVSKAKALAYNLGGNWIYDGINTWWCSDGKRSVARCCAIEDEYGRDGEVQYWLYGDGDSRRAEQYLYPAKGGVL